MLYFLGSSYQKITLYLATAMFDAFKDETDSSLECLAVKILTNDLAVNYC